jgi:hypothetical protein
MPPIPGNGSSVLDNKYGRTKFERFSEEGRGHLEALP